MSYRALSWAAKQSLPALEKLVLLMLADRADDNDKCWPSVPKLMEDCSMSRAHVQKCRKKLEERGLVRRVAQTRTYGQTSNMYYLDLSLTIEKETSDPASNRGPPASNRGPEPVTHNLSIGITCNLARGSIY
jgi:biotin operon repressor